MDADREKKKKKYHNHYYVRPIVKRCHILPLSQAGDCRLHSHQCASLGVGGITREMWVEL